MADHITIVASGGTTKILQTTDNTSYHTPAHQLVNAAGTATLGIFAEDAAHSSAHTGIQILTVRQDTAAALAGTDADYQPLITDSTGKLHVNVGAIVPGTGATNLGKIEDAAHSSGDVGVMALGVINATHTTTFGADGDYVPLATDTSGKIGIRGTYAEDAAHTGGDLGIQTLTVRQDTAAALAGTDADYQPLITDANGRLHVIAALAATQTLTTVTTVSTVTNLATIGTSVTPGGGATHLGKAEDAAHTSGDTGVFALSIRNDADATLAGTTLDYNGIATDLSGRVKVNAVNQYITADVTTTCDTSANDAGDVLFDRVTTGTISRLAGGYVVLDSVIVYDQDDQSAANMTLYFLDTDTSLGTVNAAPSISDANALKIVGRLPVLSTDFVDIGGAKLAVLKDINMPMKCDAAAQALFVAATTAGTPTQTANGIKLKLVFRQG